MKKMISLILAVLFFPVLCMAEIDLSGMAYDELVALKDQINLAIWNSQEWQEVEVPQGVWLVGEDIPAGHWTIKPVGDYASIEVGTVLDGDGRSIAAWESKFWHSESVTNPDYKYFDAAEDMPEVDFDLSEGTYILIEYSNVIFSPYAGKPSLGFK